MINGVFDDIIRVNAKWFELSQVQVLQYLFSERRFYEHVIRVKESFFPYGLFLSFFLLSLPSSSLSSCHYNLFFLTCK